MIIKMILLLQPSAVVQSRAKIKLDLFQYLFLLFNKNFFVMIYRGYHLIAIDGSKLNIPYNSKDLSSLHKGKSSAEGTFVKGYNQFHLKTAFDILAMDVIIKGISYIMSLRF